MERPAVGSFDSFLVDLRSPVEEIRLGAVIELIRNGDLRAIPSLRELASSDSSVKVRYYAKKGLQLISRSQSSDSDSPENIDYSSLSTEKSLACLNSAFEGGDVEERIRVLQGLIKSGRREIAPRILQLLNSESDPFVCSKLLIGLGILGDSTHLSAIRRFLENQDFRIRANAIEALGSIGGSEVCEILLGLLDDQDNRVKANAVRELRRFSLDIVEESLTHMVESQGEWMRDSAASALSEIGSDRFLPLMVRLLHDPSEGVRNKARTGIAGLASRNVALAQTILHDLSEGEADSATAVDGSESEGISVDSVKDGIKELTRALKNSDFQVRLQAVYSIMASGNSEYVDTIFGLLGNESDRYVRAAMVNALSKLEKSSRIRGLLLDILDDENSRVRANVVEALGQYSGDSQVEERLRNCLVDSNNRVRGNAILALRNMGRDFGDALLEMARSTNPFHQRSAVYVILEIEDEKYVGLLEELSGSSDSKVRTRAVSAIEILRDHGSPVAAACLERIHGQPGSGENIEEEFSGGDAVSSSVSADTVEIERLVFNLSSGEPDIRVESLRILAEIGDARSIEAVNASLSDVDAGVRKSARDALNSIKRREEYNSHIRKISGGGEEEISPEQYIILLNDSNRDIRLSAVMSLRMADDSILPQLEFRLKVEDDPYVISALVSTIGMLGGEQQVPLIGRFLGHSDPRVRANAVEGLCFTGSFSAAGHIIRSLSDPHPRVQDNCRSSLRHFDESEIFRALEVFCEEGIDLHFERLLQLGIQSEPPLGTKILLWILCNSEESENQGKILNLLIHSNITGTELSRCGFSACVLDGKAHELINMMLSNSGNEKVLYLTRAGSLLDKFLASELNEQAADNLTPFSETDSSPTSGAVLNTHSSHVESAMGKGAEHAGKKAVRSVHEQIAKSRDVQSGKAVSDGSGRGSDSRMDKMDRILGKISAELSDGDEETRKAAVFRLSKIDDSRAMALLEKVEQEDSSNLVRYFARRFTKTSNVRRSRVKSDPEGDNSSRSGQKMSDERGTGKNIPEKKVTPRSYGKWAAILLLIIGTVFLSFYFHEKGFESIHKFGEFLKNPSSGKPVSENSIDDIVTETESVNSKGTERPVQSALEQHLLKRVTVCIDQFVQPSEQASAEYAGGRTKWGDVFEKGGRWAKAFTEYSKAFLNNQTSMDLGLRFLRVAARCDKIDQFRETVSSSQSPWKKYYMALSLGDSVEGMKVLSEIGSVNPQARLSIALAQLKNGDFRNSVENLVSLAGSMQSPDILLPLAAALTGAGAIDQAIMALERISLMYPWMADPLHCRALLSMEKNSSDTFGFFRDSLSKNDRDPSLLLDASLAASMAGQSDEAARYIIRAWREASGSPALGRLASPELLKSGEGIFALQAFYSSGNSETMSARDRMMERYIPLTIRKKAMEVLSRAMRANPENGPFRHCLEMEYFTPFWISIEK